MSRKKAVKSKRRTFCLVVPWMALGGADRCGLDMVRHYAKKGYDTVVIATNHNASRHFKRAAFEGVARVRDLKVENTCLTTVLMEELPDIIIINNSLEAYDQIMEVRAAMPKAKIVSLMHMLLPAPWDFERTFKTGAIDLVLTVSDRLRGKLDAGWGQDVKTLHWYGFPQEGLPSMTFSPNNILCPSRIDTQKRPELIPRIAKEMQQTLPETHFIMAGSGPMEGQIRSLIKDLGVESMFTFPGELDFDGMPELYAQAGALLCPSIDEGIPLVYYEAMQLGLPMAVSDVGAVAEIVPMEYRIPLYAEYEVASYAYLLSKCLRHGMHNTQVACSARMRDEFSMAEWGKRMDGLLTE